MKKKLGVTFWKKWIFVKFSMFQSPLHVFFFRGPNHPLWGLFCHGWKKNRERHKKVANFFSALLRWLLLINYWVLSPYFGTSKTGLSRAFRNGMTIGKTPKNEVSRDKSLKQHILQGYKWKSKFFKILLLWTTLMEFLGSEGMSEGNSPFLSKIFDKKIFTQLNFWRMQLMKVTIY